MSATRDPATGRFTSVFDNVLKLATGVVGLALVAAIVTRPDGAAIIQSVAAGQSRMIKVAMGERAIIARDIPRVERLLGEMDDEILTELFAGLNDADLDWIQAQLEIG